MPSRTTIHDPDLDLIEVGDGLAILVMSVEAFVSFPLPVTGEVTIGRSSSCFVQLEDPMASRQHARLHLGESLALEDLSSINGTRLRDQRLPAGTRCPISPGEAIAIGSTLLVLQPASKGARHGRVWSHRWFETRLRDECALRQERPSPFAVVRFTLGRHVSWPKVVPLIDQDVPAPHVLAAYGPRDYEVLLVGAGTNEADALVDALRARLESCDISVKVGTATYPRDGKTADALMGHANAQLRSLPVAIDPAKRSRNPRSQSMAPVMELARKAAKTNINVLILGETGVGKEVMAQTVHRLSSRAAQPILALNCAGLAETLIESELFGHERGAFTGAIHAKRGLFEVATGGTLFLDEIGDMPLAIQGRLLRAIASREILPVGATKPRTVDVRIIAATNRDLEAEVRKGTFREDLFYRLNGMVLTIPPLRERREELEDLATKFIEEIARLNGQPAPRLAPATLELLLNHHWPGNIRELRNVVERAMVLCEGSTIDLEHLPVDRLRSQPTPLSQGQTPSAMRRDLTADEERDRDTILAALKANVWNQSRTAKALNMHRRTFVAKLDRYGIARPQKGP